MSEIPIGDAKNNKTVPHTFSADSIKAHPNPNDAFAQDDYSYQVTTAYKNTLSYPVVVMHRTNHAVRLPTCKTVDLKNQDRERALRVDVIINFSEDVDLDVTHLFDILTEKSSPELLAMKEALRKNQLRVNYGKRRIVITYLVSDRTIRNNNYSVYIDELDVVLCKDGYENHVYHPYSLQGQAILTDTTPNLFSYRVLINDPNQEFGARYININGSVYHIPPTIDQGLQAGVYIYSSSDSTTPSKFITFEEVDDLLPLYTSAKLAEQLGDAASTRRLTEEELAHQRKMKALNKEIELTELKNNVDADKTTRDHAYEIQLTEVKQQYEELKLQNQVESQNLATLKSSLEESAKIRDAELNRLKHELEMRSVQRKEGSELIKWFPAIATAIGAMFNIFL